MPIRLVIKDVDDLLVIDGGVELAATLVGKSGPVSVTETKSRHVHMIHADHILVAEVIPEFEYQRTLDRQRATAVEMREYVRRVGEID